MGTPPRLDNHHQFIGTAGRSLGSMCPSLAEPNNPLARVSTDQCLKFCDHTHICCHAPRWIMHRIEIRSIWWPVFRLRQRSAETHANGVLGSANNNNNGHDNVYRAVIKTKVIARVHPVHLMNVDWAPGGRQPSDQASWLGLWVRRKLAAIIHIHHRHCYYYSARKLILILPSYEGWKAEST